MKLALILGITGQDGSYLAELLLEKGYKIYGTKRRTSQFNTTRIDHIRDKITLRYCDLADTACLSNYIHEIIKDDFEILNFVPPTKLEDSLGDRATILEIYNLAAQSHVAISFEIPEYTADINALGTMRILEIIRTCAHRDKIRYYQASTSEMFGICTKGSLLSLDTPFDPISPYAAAKLFAHNITKIYRNGYGLYAVSSVLFNHESKRRGENFVTMKIVNGVKDIVSGKKECLYLGNLDSKRDWGHAKDYVRGIWLMLQPDTPKDYVLATGKCYSVREFVERVFLRHEMKIVWRGSELEEIGVVGDTVRVRISEEYFRPCDVDYLLGDPTLAEKELGWTREIDTLDDLIESML